MWRIGIHSNHLYVVNTITIVLRGHLIIEDLLGFLGVEHDSLLSFEIVISFS
jgi:hypothetical protein